MGSKTWKQSYTVGRFHLVLISKVISTVGNGTSLIFHSTCSRSETFIVIEDHLPSESRKPTLIISEFAQVYSVVSSLKPEKSEFPSIPLLLFSLGDLRLQLTHCPNITGKRFLVHGCQHLFLLSSSCESQRIAEIPSFLHALAYKDLCPPQPLRTLLGCGLHSHMLPIHRSWRVLLLILLNSSVCCRWGVLVRRKLSSLCQNISCYYFLHYGYFSMLRLEEERGEGIGLL